MGLLDGLLGGGNGMEGMADLGVIAGLLSGRQQDWPLMLQKLAMQKAMKEQQAQEMKMRQETHGLNQEQSRMQIEQMKRQQGLQDQLRNAAGQAFAAPQEAHGPMESGQGSPMLPGGGGMPQFQRDAMRIDPLEGMKYLPKPTQPKFHTVGGALVQEPTEPGGQARPVFQAPERKESPFGKINPADYTPDSFRKFAETGNHAVLIPYRAPREGPAGTYDSARGVVIDPRTGQARPVTMSDGSALAPKDKGGKPLTEGQAKGSLYLGMMQDAEDNVSTIKNFDVTQPNNQTLIAFARGDIKKLPPALANSAAGAEAQRYVQSSYMWSEAMLRQLTGAAAPPEEIKRNAATYFPQFGDRPEVIAQKNRARKQVTDYIRIIAGEGADQVDKVRAARQPSAEDPLGIR